MAATPPPTQVKSLIEYARANKIVPADIVNDQWPRSAQISSGKATQSFPFQFIVVERQKDGSYNPKVGAGWKFSLPLPPESLTISTPFAINTTMTMGGAVEEHNGAPVRMITLSGTTGVLFGRAEAPRPPSNLNATQQIFAGTIQEISKTGAAFQAFQAQKQNFITNTIPQTDFEDTSGIGALTGYYQFRLLQYFFEAYAELKKTKDGRNARLAFCIWKQEEVYLCSPLSFDVRRSTPNTLDYAYNITLKSTKRAHLNTGIVDAIQVYTPIHRDPEKLARLLNSVEKARAVLQGARKTVLAIGGDVQHVIFEPLRELTLFVKDALGAPLAVADLADRLIQDTKSAILDLAETRSDLMGFTNNAATRTVQVTADAKATGSQINELAAELHDSPGNSRGRAAHPANNPFLNPSDNYDFFKNLSVGSLHLKPETMSKIAQERNRIRTLTRLDFQLRRDAIAKTAAVFTNALGLGTATYNAIYGLEAPAHVSVNTPTDEDYDVIFALNRVVMELNRLVVSNDNHSSSKINAIAAVAGLATRSGIAFRIPKSKFAVPFPYGSTLEMLALRYLKDPNRWHEIAALNGLQSPYVDEVGFELPLLVDGAENKIFLASNTQLYVGQPVWISSTTSGTSQRRIVKIEPLSSNQTMITLDGPSDLGRYTKLAKAKLTVFSANTVNSQQMIYIPSDTEAPEDGFITRNIPGVDAFDKLLAIGGVDLLLTPANDLVLTPEGDTRWAFGLNNIVQEVRLALSIRAGTLLQHPEFGLPLAVGTSIADINATDIIRAAQEMFAHNPKYSGIKAAKIDISGPLARLNIAVELAQVNHILPISADILR